MPKYREGWMPHKLCKVCQTIKDGDESLFKRVAESRQYAKGGESLKSIMRDYVGQFGYQSLYGHARKHQAPTAGDLIVTRVNVAQAKRDGEAYRSIVKSTDARQNIIEILHSILSDPDQFRRMDPEKQVALLLRALKDSDDTSAKRKDQEIDILKMMMPHRSGEVVEAVPVKPEYDPWEASEDE